MRGVTGSSPVLPKLLFCFCHAGVAELADAHDSESCGATRAGSIPVSSIFPDGKVLRRGNSREIVYGAALTFIAYEFTTHCHQSPGAI